jgi:GxxExxY protein
MFLGGLCEAGIWYNVLVKLQDDPKAYAIMGCAMRVHKTLGFGFLESVYGDALEIEFKKAGIPYEREDDIRIYYDGKPLPTTYRADFTCYGREYIVELKAIKALSKIEWAQVIHYMRATRIKYALLINFGREQIQYDAFDLDRLPSASVLDPLSTATQSQIKSFPTRPVISESEARSPDHSAER